MFTGYLPTPEREEEKFLVVRNDLTFMHVIWADDTYRYYISWVSTDFRHLATKFCQEDVAQWFIDLDKKYVGNSEYAIVKFVKMI